MKKLSLLFALLLFVVPVFSQASPARSDLRGKILLQVEENGEAWYVKPEDGSRMYMEDGTAAYGMMRNLGLGISNADIAKIPVGFEDRLECLDSDSDGLCDKLEDGLGTDKYNADSDGDSYDDGAEIKAGYDPLSTGKLTYDNNLADRLKGKILLQVETNGEAWYINPDDNKRYYMPDGPSAYQIMRYLSLGINNSDLAKIDIEGEESSENLLTYNNNEINYTFEYNENIWAITYSENVRGVYLDKKIDQVDRTYVTIVPHYYIDCLDLVSCAAELKTEIVDWSYEGMEQVLESNTLLGGRDVLKYEVVDNSIGTNEIMYIFLDKDFVIHELSVSLPKSRGEVAIQEFNQIVDSFEFLEPAICRADFMTEATGMTMHPIKEAHEDFRWLGQIFSSENCQADRIEQIYGVNDGEFTIGLNISLYPNAPVEARVILEDIGFINDVENVDKYTLPSSENVSLENLLRLKPYTEFILSDDCINCG